MAKDFIPQEENGERFFAYIIIVDNKIYKTVCTSFKATESNMIKNASYMAQTAQAFRKRDVGILVYEAGVKDNEIVWHYCHNCEVSYYHVKDFVPFYPKNGLPNPINEGVFI